MPHVLRFLAAVTALLAGAALICGASTVVAGRGGGVAAEAAALSAEPFVREPGAEVVVITGSSTVRLWDSSDTAFPDAQVVNTGFGGSTMDQLLAHYPGLIGRFAPDQVYIGSGDNDVARGRAPAEVIADTERLLAAIARDHPGTTVAIIAAKPSLQRWFLRDRYESLNEQFAALAADDPNVAFVDVWKELLDADGRVRPELYAGDGLHLNSRGYRIYSAAIATAAYPAA